MIQSAYKTGFDREIKRGRTVFLPKYINHHIKPFNKNHSVFQPSVDIGIHRQRAFRMYQNIYKAFFTWVVLPHFPHQPIKMMTTLYSKGAKYCFVAYFENNIKIISIL